MVKHYIATLLAPKSLTPVAIWALPARRLGLYTLKGKLLVKGRFDEELQDYDPVQDSDTLWARFHSEPLKKSDRGRGFGCALYLGAALTVQAFFENSALSLALGDPPGVKGIYSEPEDRSDLANNLWASLHKKKVARYSTSTIGIWQRHTFKFKGSWTDARLQKHHDTRYSPSMSYLQGVRCRGGYTYGEYHHLQYFHYDLLDAQEVLYSARVLHLGPDFECPESFVPVTPSEFGSADWKGVSDRKVADFLWTGATASGNRKKYLRAVCRSWKSSKHLSQILNLLPQKGEIREGRVIIEGLFPRGIRL